MKVKEAKNSTHENPIYAITVKGVTFNLTRSECRQFIQIIDNNIAN
jgi:hypothetical protein